MCCKGRIIGFTRYGVDKMKDSTLMLASFEKTTDFLFDAASQAKHDRLKGVS
jgi:DNA-directed RNA polymerase III subunit RPC1